MAQVLAHGHGPNFRDALLNLLDHFLNLLLGGRRPYSNIDHVNLIWSAHDPLQKRQRKDYRTIFDDRPTFYDSHDFQFLRFNLERVADLLLKHVCRCLTQNHRLFRGIARHAPGNKFQIVPGKASPLARGQNHQIGVFNTGYLHEDIASRTDTRKVGDPIADGAVKRFWSKRSTPAADDNVGSARFQPYLPAFLKAP